MGAEERKNPGTPTGILRRRRVRAALPLPSRRSQAISMAANSFNLAFARQNQNPNVQLALVLPCLLVHACAEIPKV